MSSESKKPPVEYWWFQGPSVRELIWQLSQVDEATAILKCAPDKDGKLWLTVINGEDKIPVAGAINESEECPPICLQ